MVNNKKSEDDKKFENKEKSFKKSMYLMIVIATIFIISMHIAESYRIY